MVDEVSIDPTTRQEAILFFRIAAYRYGRGSIQITTRKGFRVAGSAGRPRSVGDGDSRPAAQPKPDLWRGLMRYLALFAIDLTTRRIVIAGMSPSPDGHCVDQLARNLTDGDQGFLAGSRYLIHDRDPLFTNSFEVIPRECRRRASSPRHYSIPS